MFCWSWLAGYLRRGLGIPPAGGMGEGGRGGGERESFSMCLLCPDINLETMLSSFVTYVLLNMISEMF